MFVAMLARQGFQLNFNYLSYYRTNLKIDFTAQWRQLIIFKFKVEKQTTTTIFAVFKSFLIITNW